MLAAIGRLLIGVFIPIGISDWRVSAALITGFTAKEAVIGALAVSAGAGLSDVGGTLHALFTPLTALSFLIFTLLYTPCVAAVSAAKREFGGLKGTAFIVLYQTGFAWLAAVLVYQVGKMVF
jgi:ferrous iron transport protein B